MNNKKGDGKSVIRGILFAENIGKAVFIFLLLLLATTFVASAQPCNHSVTVQGWCCENKTEAWFYYESGYWSPVTIQQGTALFNLSIDGELFDAYCINPEIVLKRNDTFNASIYQAEPSCGNNSIAYILNNWTQDCVDCNIINASQSAIWYFWFIDEPVCSLGEPAQYNHTALPNQTGWVSNWIPVCTAHQKACDFINASINKSVPYSISITPSSGSFPAGTPIELEARVSYCAGEGKEGVTVLFGASNGCTFESGNSTFENTTINDKAQAMLTCDPSVDSVTVTAGVKDMKWFEIIDPKGCNVEDYQETIRIVNITDNAQFRFYTNRVPTLSLPLIIVLAVMMSVIAITAIRKKK